MNVRGGRNLFGKTAEQEIQKRKFREVPFAYPEHEEAETNTYKTTKSAAVQKVRRFEESDDSKAPSGLVTYPTIHINRNYERYLRQTGKPEDDNSKSVSRRTRSGTDEKSRSVSAVSFKIKSTEASVKLQNKTESFEILKSAYEDDEDDDITESSDNCDIDYASRSRGNDDNPVFKVPKAPTHSDPKVDMFKKLDPDTYDKISELLAQKELIEKQLKTIAEHGGDELPPVAIEKTEMYGSQRRKHKDHRERVDWGTNVREEDEPYERRVKGREITRSTGGTSRSYSDQYRSDREPERYYDLQRSDSSYTGADRHRMDPVPIRPASSMGSHGLDPGYSSEHSRGLTSSRESKDLHTLEREYQAFSETVGVNESSFSTSSQISILKKSSDPSYHSDNAYSQQNFQSGYQNYNPAFITGQGLLPTPSSTGQSKSSYHTPQSSGQALMRTPETGHGLLPTPTSGVDQMQQFQSSFSSQGLLPTPNQKGNSLMPEPTVVEKPFDAIKKTLNLLNIKLSESGKTETGNEKGGAHLSGNNPPVSGPIDQAALDEIGQSMLSAKRQLESLRNPGYDQTNQLGNPGKYKNVLPPEIRNIEHQHTDDYDFCEYDSWRDSRHAKYVEEVPHRRRDHQETDLDTDIYYRKDTYSDRPDFESSREYDRRSRPSHDPYPPEHSERSRDYNPSSHDPYQPEQSERSQAYDPYELESERSEDYNPLPYDPYLPEHSERSQDYDRNRRSHDSFSREIFEGHKDDFESRNQHYDNIDSNTRQQRFPSAERKTNQPPSLMSLQVLPTKNIGRSSKQPTADLQAPAMVKDQGWKENPSYRPSVNSDPDYNPYLDGDDDNEHSQETRAQTSDGKFRNRPSRFSQIDNQHQGRDYPAIDIPTESMAALPDRSERLPFIDRQHNREMGRDLNKFGETRPVPVSSSQHTDKLPGSNRKRKSRFEPAGDDYGYPDQQNPPPGHRNKLGREEGYSHGYGVETEPKWGSQAHSDFPPDSDSSALLNARGSLNDIFEEVVNLPHPESRHGDFNINRTNHPRLIDFPHSAFEHISAIDQPGFGPQTAKQPRIPGLQPPMRGLPDSNKPNFPRNDNREQNISRPFPPKYQNVDQPNAKPFPPYGREQLVSKPIPRPPPGRDVITGNINIKSQLVTSAESSKQIASELSANNTVPVKIPYDTGPSGRPNFMEGGQETLNRGKRPASNLAINTEVSLAKQKKAGCVNCGSLDHIKCPKSRKIQIEGTPKYGEQHGLPNLSKPGQRRESSSQDNEGAGKITSIPTNIMSAPTKITSALPKITSAPDKIPSALTKINPVPAKINTTPAKGNNPQDKNVQQYPEESRRCVDDLRSYLQNYKRNRSSMEPVSALTSASKAYSANLSYKDIIMITEGEPDKYSGALYAKQSIFLARGISDNKATIKETVYNMAVENLLNMTTAEILAQKDFGFPVRTFDDEEEDHREPWPEGGMKCQVENCETPVIETFKKYIDHWHKFHETYISSYMCPSCNYRCFHRWELTRHFKRKHKMEDEICKEKASSVTAVKIQNRRYIPTNDVLPPRKPRSDDSKSGDITVTQKDNMEDIIKENETDDLTVKKKGKSDDITVNENGKTGSITTSETGKIGDITSKKKDKSDSITDVNGDKTLSDNVKAGEANRHDDITGCKRDSTGDSKEKKKSKPEDITANKKMKTDDITANKRDNKDDITTNKNNKTDVIKANKKGKIDIVKNEKDKRQSATTTRKTDKINQKKDTVQEPQKSEKKNEDVKKPNSSTRQNVAIRGNMSTRRAQNLNRGHVATRGGQGFNRGNTGMRGVMNLTRGNMNTRGALNPHSGNMAMRGELNPHEGNMPMRGELNPHEGNMAMRGELNPHSGNMAMRGELNPHSGNMAMRGELNPHSGNMAMRGELNPHEGNMAMRGELNPHVGNMSMRGELNPHSGNMPMNPHEGNMVTRGVFNMHRGNMGTRGALNPHPGNMATRGAFNVQRGNMAMRGAFKTPRGDMAMRGAFNTPRGDMTMRGALNPNRVEGAHPFFSR